MKTKQCNGCDEQIKISKKWCTSCLKIVKREQNKITQKIKRQSFRRLCKECEVTYTGTEYCNPCSQRVRSRNIQNEKAKHPKLCRECDTDISHRQKNARLCEKCVVIVDARNYEKRKVDMRANKVVKQEIDLSKWTKRGTIHYEGLRSLAV